MPEKIKLIILSINMSSLNILNSSTMLKVEDLKCYMYVAKTDISYEIYEIHFRDTKVMLKTFYVEFDGTVNMKTQNSTVLNIEDPIFISILNHITMVGYESYKTHNDTLSYIIDCIMRDIRQTKIKNIIG